MDSLIQTLRTFLKPIIPRKAWDFIRKKRVKFNQKHFKRHWIYQEYAGNFLNILIADPVAHEWYSRPWQKPEEFAFMNMKPGAIVFDLGSHQGIVAAIIAYEIGLAGKVIALEANSHNHHVAMENIKKNNLQNVVHLIHGAAGCAPGKIFFNENFNGQVDDGSGSFGQVEVNVYSPDSLVTEFGIPDYMFVDVEGYECEVLKGAKQIFKFHKTNYFIEVHAAEELERFNGSLETILSFFPFDKFDLYAKILDSTCGFLPFSECGIDIKTYRKRFYLIAKYKIPLE